ncbi:hypothetical protein MNBD_GAMMA08-278 [hydrothermal vent metagenome]|uniref:Lipoprotein n=1 Tax=hydrothermal vent metagenome TaxID=652676 RepID=A0A3B0Y6R4_9ZZZZ
MAAKRISALFFMMLFISALNGCGKTGPLYLPDAQTKLTEPTGTNH